MVDVELGPMTEVDATRGTRRPRSFWVAIALVAVLVAVLTGALRVYLDSRPGEVPREVAAVLAYVSAVNTGDADRLRHVVAPDVVWMAAGADRVGAGPFTGVKYLDFQTSLPSFRCELLGDPVVLGNQVAVPTRISAQLPGAYGEGMTVFTLVTVGGTPMITEILWDPAPHYR